ncbi:MAG: AAA family ATPase [Chloroflexota bacterium]
MLGPDDQIKALREALALSPDNVPLRQHLAQSLLSLGRSPEAEVEYRAALALTPGSTALQLGLATAFFQQGKSNEAFVIVEELTRGSSALPSALLLHARLLLSTGDSDRAKLQYRRAIEVEPSLADADLAQRLGVQPGTVEPPPRVRVPAGDAPDTERSPLPRTDLERPSLTFADVGGLDAVKEEIRLKIIHPLTHADLYRAYGKSVGGGILLYGPPGCGKTYLARATAGEIKAGFLVVGINDVLDMWLGNSERNLHDLFEQARGAQPCVLFFDEVDALGASRTDLRQSAGRHLINQFLSEMDGVQSSNDGVLILAATNAPWHLDSAFRRPGRFDRIIFVPPPDRDARADVLRALCRGKPLDTVDFASVADRTDGFSGADLKAVVDQAVELKLREALRDGVPRPITTADLATAARAVKPSTREWFATARNYALYSNQGGVYDDIVKYLKL